MKAFIILISLPLCGVSVSKAQTVLKAAASDNKFLDCFYQCSSLTFRDKNSMVNGNCKTTYNGGQWGYITDEAARNGDCPDARSSKQFQGGQWSYFSCTTSSTRQCVFDAVRSGGCSSSAFNSRVNVKSSFRPSDASSSDPSSP